MGFYIDTHFHLFLDDFNLKFTPEEIIKDSLNKNVLKLWLASTNKRDILKNLNFCTKYPDNLKAWVGFHPENVLEYDIKFLKNILKNSKYADLIIGLGEIGIDLDDFVLELFKKNGLSNKNLLLSQQKKAFYEQIELALDFNLPFAVHSRKAFKPTFDVLKSFTNAHFVWHCYNLNKDRTIKLLNTFKNIYFGFNSIITYKSGEYVLDSLKYIPLNRILVETDAPFLSPRPFVYKHNTPIGVIPVYTKIAKIFNISTESLQEIVYKNALSLSKLQ